MTRTILTLCGGIGGAKLVYGLSQIIPDENLINLVNTGDDFIHYGLNIGCLLYTSPSPRDGLLSRMPSSA